MRSGADDGALLHTSCPVAMMNPLLQRHLYLDLVVCTHESAAALRRQHTQGAVLQAAVAGPLHPFPVTPRDLGQFRPPRNITHRPLFRSPCFRWPPETSP